MFFMSGKNTMRGLNFVLNQSNMRKGFPCVEALLLCGYATMA